MKILNATVLLLCLISIIACKPSSPKEAAQEIYSVDSILTIQDALIGDTFMLEGFCVDVCGHGSNHITLLGSDTTRFVNVEANSELVSFDKGVLNNNVCVKATIAEERVDEAFLSNWEQRLDESLKAPDGGNPEAVAMLKKQIEQIRAEIAERTKKENKNYYSQYHIIASEYEIEK